MYKAEFVSAPAMLEAYQHAGSLSKETIEG